MKKILLSAFVLTGFSLFGAINFNAVEDKDNDNKNTAKPIVEGIRTIDSGDTVVFDLTQITDLGNMVSFPVSIISDDPIQSLDFSLKYNQTDLNWDTINLNTTNILNATQNFNESDLTLRFTSYILDFNQNYVLTEPIVDIKFNVLAGVLDSSDLDIVAAYLNGNACSYIVRVDAAVGVENTMKKAAFVNVFPNPTSNFVSLSCSDNAVAEIFDLNGKSIISNIELNAGQNTSIATSDIASGIYFVKFTSSNKTQFRKLIVQ
jgi:hypothetical protein